MADADHPTRQRLLLAGAQLTATAPDDDTHDRLKGISVDRIVKRAHTSKGTFYWHFKDRDDYLHALAPFIEEHRDLVPPKQRPTDYLELPPQARHPTARRLMDALIDLANRDNTPLAAISINQIIEQADLSKGAFYGHFRSRTDFLIATNDYVYALVGNLSNVAETFRWAPGAARAYGAGMHMADAYLKDPKLPRFISKSHAIPELETRFWQAAQGFRDLLTQDFTALGWPRPDTMGIIFHTSGTALMDAELGAGERNDRARQGLWDLLTATPPRTPQAKPDDNAPR